MKTVFLSLLALVVAAASASAQNVALRPGDQIELRLGGVPQEDAGQVSGSYQVDGGGFVNLPHIGRVKAAGLTQDALQNSIEQTYRGQQIYTNPTITINIPATARFVNVGGDVKNPRRVEYTPDLTVLGAINGAGGFTDYADQRRVRLLRDGQAIIIDIRDVRKNPSKDVPLKPGDSIEVPQSFW